MKFAIFWVICLHLCDSINSFNLSSRKWKWKHHKLICNSLLPGCNQDGNCQEALEDKLSCLLFCVMFQSCPKRAGKAAVGNLPSLMESFHCLLQAPRREKKWWLWRLKHLPLYLQRPFSHLKFHFSKWGLELNCNRHCWLLWHSIVACIWFMGTCSLALRNIVH